MSFFENITVRRQRSKSTTELTNLSQNSSNNSTLDGTANSLPNITDDESDEILELKRRIDELESKLLVAHEEINHLSLENTELKTTLHNLDNKHQLFMRATKKITSEIGTPTKNKQLLTPRKKGSNTSTTVTPNRLETTQIAPKDPPIQCINQSVEISQASTNNSSRKSMEMPKSTEIQVERRKLCIISSNKTNKILQIAENTVQNFQICHYLTPNCSIKQLINNLGSKLENYSINDYCVIMIGADDFSKTNNYFNLIVYIREMLKPITHTNIILCLPTYRYHEYSMMYNWRVETFNNMLYMDNESHNYAIIFDSNLELSCDYYMFSKYSGLLNNNGMINIFQYLNQLITDNIMYLDTETNKEELQIHNLNPKKDDNPVFFRK